MSGQEHRLIRMDEYRGGDFNCNPKEHNSSSYRNPQNAGHTNGRNYLGLVDYFDFTLHKRYFLPDFSVTAEKVY
jgi:hypothetical protein